MNKSYFVIENRINLVKNKAYADFKKLKKNAQTRVKVPLVTVNDVRVN